MTKCKGPHHDFDDFTTFTTFTTCNGSRNSFLHCKSGFYIDHKSWRLWKSWGHQVVKSSCGPLHFVIRDNRQETRDKGPPMRVSQGWGLRCRWDLLRIGNSERTFKIMIYSEHSFDFLPLWISRFWEFWSNHLKSRLQLNDVPVHKTHWAEVRKIITTSKTPSLYRVDGRGVKYFRP